MQEQLSSITDFLRQGDFQFRIFDLGRRVCRVSNQLFEKIENQQAVYPYPFQQSAWLAIVFWDKAKRNEAIIWFLRFPIDELGYLQLASRDAFLQQLFDQLAQNARAQQQGQTLADTLKESPFAFKPNEDRLAVFHAKTNKILGQKASHYYAHTQYYLRGDVGYEQWKFLGLQGIADIIARLDEDNNAAVLAKAIPHIPEQPLSIIANLLEHSEPNKVLSDVLLKKLQQQFEPFSASSDIQASITTTQIQAAIPLLAALLHALSNSQIASIRQQAWHLLLQSNLSTEIELLAVLSGRAWQDLRDETLFHTFLEALAHCSPEQFFILLVDLMALPNMREPLLKVMRSRERSEQLAQRIGLFFQMSRGA
jgi:hypothetical protein